MAKVTADSLREEAEALGGASRSIDSGLKREGETSPSNESEQDIERKDVSAEEPEEEKELDEEAEEDEEEMEEGESPDLEEKVDEPKSEDDDDEEEDEEEDDDADQGDGNRKKRPDQNQRREKRGDDENARRRLEARQNKQNEVNELREKVRQYEEADSKRAQEAIKGEITALAAELKSDPGGLEKVINLAVKIAEQKIGSKLPSKATLDSITSKAQVSKFDTDFNAAPVQDYLATTYPRATAKQLADARVLLKKQSKGSTAPLDYFLLKNKKDYDAILDPRRRRGLETARRHGTDTQVDDRDTGSSKGIDRLDDTYREAGAGSGLRRERTSEKTF